MTVPTPASPSTPPDAPPPPRLARGLPRLLLRALAIVSLVLAALGVVLPGLPTTPFVLLAAWAAARSSPRLAAWLYAHKLFGPMIRDWQSGGFVSRRAKWSATIGMLFCGLMIWLASPVRWAVFASITPMVIVGIWLWRRPEPAATTVAASAEKN